VSERNVVRGARQPAGRDRVGHAGRDLALSPAEERAIGEQVPEDHVDPVVAERRRHRAENVPHALGVALVPRLCGIEQRGRVAEAPFGDERNAGNERRLRSVARTHLDHAAGGRGRDAGDDGHADRLEQRAERRESDRGIVIAGDHHHRDPQFVQAHERLEHERVRLRSRGPLFVHIACEEHRVDSFVLRDADDLVERGGELVVEPRPSPDRLAHVPVGGVEQPHPVSPSRTWRTDPRRPVVPPRRRGWPTRGTGTGSATGPGRAAAAGSSSRV